MGFVAPKPLEYLHYYYLKASSQIHFLTCSTFVLSPGKRNQGQSINVRSVSLCASLVLAPSVSPTCIRIRVIFPLPFYFLFPKAAALFLYLKSFK